MSAVLCQDVPSVAAPRLFQSRPLEVNSWPERQGNDTLEARPALV